MELFFKDDFLHMEFANLNIMQNKQPASMEDELLVLFWLPPVVSKL